MKKRVLDRENIIFFQEENYLEIYHKIKSGEYKELKKLKDDQRSKVSLLEIEGQKFVYKEPTEKNNRLWQRILSIYRGGEAKREFLNCEKIKKLQLLGPKPILAMEKKKKFMTVGSFFIMEYIQGAPAETKDLNLVVEALKFIHEKGYLHGDSQLSNFMIKDGEVYLVDCKLSKNIYGILGKIWEFIYFEQSCYRDIKSGYENKFLYKSLKKLGEKIDSFNYVRKALRKKLKGE